MCIRDSSLVVSGLADGFDMTGAEFLGGTGTGREWLIAKDSLGSGAAGVVVPKNYSGTLNFTTRAVTVEDDGNANPNAATANVTIQVTPTPEASMNLTASGKEDVPAKLDFSVRHQNGDTDETIQAVWIKASDVDDPSHKVTLTLGAAGPALTATDGWYKIENADLNNIYAKGPANLGDAEVRFGVKYTVGDAPADGTLPMATKQFDGEYTLKLAPVTDETRSSVATIAEGTGTMTVNGTTGLTITKVGGNSQATFSVDVKVDQKADPKAGGVADTDGSEKLSYLIVDNVPNGVSIKGGFLVGAGTPEPGDVTGGAFPVNRWMVEVPEGESAFAGGPLTKTLEFTLDNSGGIFNNSQRSYTMKATAFSKDGTALELEQSQTSWVLNTNITAAGNSNYIPPTLEATKKDFAATEDQPITLNDLIGVKVLATGNDRAGTYVITLKGLDPRIEVEGMTKTQVADGHGGMQDAWTASAQGAGDLASADASVQALLQRVTLKLPQDWNSNKAPGDALDIKFDADIRGYTVASKTSDETTYGHADLKDIEPTGITPVTDPMTMTVAAPGVAEGAPVPITIDLANTADGANTTIVDGKMYVQIAEPANGTGGTLEYQGTTITQTNVSGVAGLADGKYYVLEGVSVGGAQGSGIVSLTYRPETHASGDFTVKAHVVSQEANAASTVTSTAAQTVHVGAVNSGYDLQIASARGAEDTRVQIQVEGTGLNDKDGSEAVVAAKLEHVPNDYKVFVGADAASAQEAQNVGDGTWGIPLTEGKLPGYIAVEAPKNFSGTASGITLTVYSGEAGQSPKADAKTFDVVFDAKADGLTINPTQTFGKANQDIHINLNATVADTDGSETVTLTLKGLGSGATFTKGNAAYDADSDTYTISGIAHNEVPDLAFKTNWNLDKDITVTAKTVDVANAGTANESTDTSPEVGGTFHMTVTGGTNPPIPPSPIVGLGRSASISALLPGAEEAEPLFDADGNPIDLSLDPATAALGASLPGEGSLPEGTDAESDAAIDEAAALLPVDAEAPNTDIPDLPDAEPAEGTDLLDLTADLPAADAIDLLDTGTEAGVPELDDAPLADAADADLPTADAIAPLDTETEAGVPELDDAPLADAADAAPVEETPELGGTSGEDTLDLNGVADMGSDAANEGTTELSGLTADDVLDVGGGDLPLPGEDAPDAIPEVAGTPADFYAPPVPDAAVTIAQEMDDAIQP